MAQTKTTARSRASSAKGSSKRSGGSKNGSRAQSRGLSTQKRSTSKNGSRAQARSKSGSSSGSRKQPRARQSNISAFAHKAKGPALAGGAALMGLAGGMALKNGGKRNGKGLSKNLSLSFPKGKGSTVKIVAGAAKEIAKGGYKIGQLTSEVRKVREAVEAQND